MCCKRVVKRMRCNAEVALLSGSWNRRYKLTRHNGRHERARLDTVEAISRQNIVRTKHGLRGNQASPCDAYRHDPQVRRQDAAVASCPQVAVQPAGAPKEGTNKQENPSPYGARRTRAFGPFLTFLSKTMPRARGGGAHQRSVAQPPPSKLLSTVRATHGLFQASTCGQMLVSAGSMRDR